MIRISSANRSRAATSECHRRPAESKPSSSALQSGTAAIELVLILPLLLLIAMACVDLGRAIHEYQVLGNAVQVGSDYAATHRFTPYTESGWEAKIDAAVLEEMQNTPNFDSARLQITTGSFYDADARLCVRIQGDYEFLTIVDWPGLPDHLHLRQVITQRQVR